MAAKCIPGFDRFEELWGERAPLGWDITDPEPAARACVALLSDWFPATTGEIVHVDGGAHAMGGEPRSSALALRVGPSRALSTAPGTAQWSHPVGQSAEAMRQGGPSSERVATAAILLLEAAHPQRSRPHAGLGTIADFEAQLDKLSTAPASTPSAITSAGSVPSPSDVLGVAIALSSYPTEHTHDRDQHIMNTALSRSL